MKMKNKWNFTYKCLTPGAYKICQFLDNFKVILGLASPWFERFNFMLKRTILLNLGFAYIGNLNL